IKIVVIFSHRFAINYKSGPNDDDIIFHFNPRIYQHCVVCDSFQNGSWVCFESNSGCSLSSGSAFDIFIVTKNEGANHTLKNKSAEKFCHIRTVLFPQRGIFIKENCEV
uniref:Galectin n=1 Tax=Astyanax mexicanus TaxID=7994 RepID=A0A8B9HML1_ASTMX